MILRSRLGMDDEARGGGGAEPEEAEEEGRW